MSPPLKHVWIDLMPMLPGGANGGAKHFICQLLQQLAARNPQANFTAVCQAATVPELRAIEATNLTLKIEGDTDTKGTLEQKRWLGSRRLARLHNKIIRRLTQPPPEIQLLYCPFGVPLIKRSGPATVCTFYDLLVDAYPSFFPAEVQRERLGHFQRMADSATKIAAISKFSRDLAIKKGVEKERIQEIPIQISLPIPPDQSQSSEKMPPLALKHQNYFLYPANLWKHKNHELLFTAFGMARQQGLNTDMKLVCSGDGLDRLNELRDIAMGLGLADAIILPGFVTNTTLESLYHHALGVVFPSLYEGFGMPVIEAMARGIPVACSNTTALQEVAESGALLFHPGKPQEIADALILISGDADLRRRLIQQGRIQAKGYQDPCKMADEYWNLFIEAHESRTAQ